MRKNSMILGNNKKNLLNLGNYLNLKHLNIILLKEKKLYR